MRGIQGPGKSSFLSLLWFALLKSYAEDDYGVFPCYVDLHYYDIMHEEKAVIELKKDLNIIRETVQGLELNKVFFILDGIDAYRRDLPTLQKILYDHIKEYSFRTVCLGSAEHIPSEYNLLEDSVWMELDYCISLTVHSIDRKDRITLKNIANNVNALFSPKQSISCSSLVATALRYSIDAIDFRTLVLIAKVADQGITVNPKNFGAALWTYYVHNVTKKRLLIESQYAASYQFGIEPDVKATTPNILQHKNRVIRDFLTAFDFHQAICQNAQKGKRRIKRIDAYCKLRQTFSVSTNRFLKDLFGSLTDDEQIKYIEVLAGQLNKEEISTEMKSQIAYMLGRANGTSANKARSALRELYMDLWGDCFYGDHMLKKHAQSDTAKLVLFRSAVVSLLKLNQLDCMQTYLRCLLYNDRLMEINRAFHQQYYDDIEQRTETCSYEDDGTSSFEITRQMLSANIRAAIETGKVSYPVYLDVVTIFSFAISRSNELEAVIKDELILLANDILEALNTRDRMTSLFKIPIVRSYVTLSRDILSKGKYFFIEMIKELYSLKTRKRQGWVQRKIESSESIADHMYFSVLLAIFFLPPRLEIREDEEIGEERQNRRQYSKEKVISMLLIHDLGEALEGDKITTEKDEGDRIREKDRVRYYGVLTALPHVFGLGSYSDLYAEYDDQQSINARIAKDIDLIEAYLQACLYAVKNDGVNVREWSEYVRQRLQTRVGKDIKYMMDLYVKRVLREEGDHSMVQIKDKKYSETADEVVIVHISDLHYDEKNGVTNTKLMLQKLQEQLQVIIRQEFGDPTVPCLLLCTGDYRYAKTQKENTAEQDAKAVANYILELAKSIQVSTDGIIIVPGNHDLNRSHRHLRDTIVTGLYNDYLETIGENGVLKHPEHLKELMEGFSYFHLILVHLYGEIRGNIIWQEWCQKGCRIESVAGLQFLLLNTALFSSNVKPEDSMIFGWGYPVNEMKSLDHETVVIPLGHHGYQFLHRDEQKQFKAIMCNLESPCKVYLCGHAHDIDITDIGNSITQFTAGTLRQDDKVEKAGIYVGMFSRETKQLTMKSVYWDKQDKEWRIDKNIARGNGQQVISMQKN